MRLVAVASLKRGIIDPPEPVEDVPPVLLELESELGQLRHERDDLWRLVWERDPETLGLRMVSGL